MSANNRLLVTKTIEGKFRVADIDVDGGGSFFIGEADFDSLEEAVKAANKYMRSREVEYGLQIDLEANNPKL